jgi:hypothetical protein
MNYFFIIPFKVSSTASVINGSEFLATDTEVPGLIPVATRFFWEVVGLERGPLNLVRIIEELLERIVAASVKKTEINGRRDLLRWLRDTLYPLKLAPSSPTSGGRSVGIVRWRTKPRNFFLSFINELVLVFAIA